MARHEVGPCTDSTLSRCLASEPHKKLQAFSQPPVRRQTKRKREHERGEDARGGRHGSGLCGWRQEAGSGREDRGDHRQGLWRSLGTIAVSVPLPLLAPSFYSSTLTLPGLFSAPKHASRSCGGRPTEPAGLKARVAAGRLGRIPMRWHSRLRFPRYGRPRHCSCSGPAARSPPSACQLAAGQEQGGRGRDDNLAARDSGGRGAITTHAATIEGMLRRPQRPRRPTAHGPARAGALNWDANPDRSQHPGTGC